MTVRDILHHLEQAYGTQLSHEQVSRSTDADGGKHVLSTWLARIPVTSRTSRL